MSTFTQILYQIVFGSKNIIPFIHSENKFRLLKYMAAICQNKKCLPYIVGGARNHIHLIISLHPFQALSGLIKDLKVAFNHMMSENHDLFRSFPGWQVGYGSFTYHYSSKEQLIKYVEKQDEHHKMISFEEELIELCKEFGIENNLKYLLD
jgi:REP element-mobilizing transposase RayT